MMKLWLIEQSASRHDDSYISAVVAARTEAAAKLTHPCSSHRDWDGKADATWADVRRVSATLIGNAVKGTAAGVICASFNAG